MATNYRGFQVSPDRSLIDVQAAIDFGANIIRCQILTVDENILGDPVAYVAWWKGEMEKLAAEIFPYIPANVKIIIDNHSAPGGNANGKLRMFLDQKWARQVFISCWKWTTERFKNFTTPYVFNLINEPGATVVQVATLMKDTVAVIRAVDKKRRVAVTTPYCSPEKLSGMFFDFKDEYMWLNVHCYFHPSFSHQGVNGSPSPVNYPNPNLTKAKLEKYLTPLINWSHKNSRARILIGEHGCTTFAPEISRINWFRDFESIFEINGWNWIIHAWREWPGWSVEGFTSLTPFVHEQLSKNGG